MNVFPLRKVLLGNKTDTLPALYLHLAPDTPNVCKSKKPAEILSAESFTKVQTEWKNAFL